MNARPERKKMCWNCEGNVSLKADNCPYCQAALYPETEVDEVVQSKYEYPSPYKPPKSEFTMGQAMAPSSPFVGKSKEEVMSEDGNEEDEEGVDEEIMPFGDAKTIIVTMSMLMGGLVFFLFGLLLLLFSSNGYLVLRWNNDYWFLYAGLGTLMLILGFFNLKNVSEEE